MTHSLVSILDFCYFDQKVNICHIIKSKLLRNMFIVKLIVLVS